MNVVNRGFSSARFLLVEGPTLESLASAVPAGECNAAERKGMCKPGNCVHTQVIMPIPR